MNEGLSPCREGMCPFSTKRNDTPNQRRERIDTCTEEQANEDNPRHTETHANEPPPLDRLGFHGRHTANRIGVYIALPIGMSGTPDSGRSVVFWSSVDGLIDVSGGDVESSQGDRLEIEEDERDSVEQDIAPDPREMNVPDT